MISRLAAVIAAGVLVATGLATSATAAAPALTDTVRIANNLDTGHNGYWAWLNFRRTTTITKTVDRENEADTYQVVLNDAGELRTIRGANSPEAGVRIANSVPGSVHGTFTLNVTSAVEPTSVGVKPYYNYRCRPDNTPDRAQDCGGMPKSTSDWYKLYFGDNATLVSSSYSWTYKTCAEQWTDNGTRGLGDITGKRCDKAVTADAPTAKDPACDASKGTLTIPSERGVRYEVNGRTWRAGTFDVRPGRYVVTAYARDGYRLVGDPLWRLKVDRAEACPSPSATPTVTPTVTVSPTPTDTPEVREVTPKAPVLEQATCDDKTASVTIPEVAGVVYKNSSGKELEQGTTYSAKPGSITVTAEAADGYTLADGAKAEWTLVVSEAPKDCPTATPTTTTHVTVVNNIPVPSRVDTGLGGLAK